MDLKNKVVVITGGSKGFGRALAEEFIKEDSKVVISSHVQANIDQASKELGVLGVLADVTKEEDLINLADVVKKEFGQIDIWVNNAGIFRERKNAEDFDMQKVREMYEVNVFGLMNGSRVALREMKKNNSGFIVNIISSAALLGRAEISTYASSKWAARGFTDSIREENKDKDITVLSVYPGGMRTDIFGKDKASDFELYLDPKMIAKKVIDNLKRNSPEIELILTRPNVLK